MKVGRRGIPRPSGTTVGEVIEAAFQKKTQENKYQILQEECGEEEEEANEKNIKNKEMSPINSSVVYSARACNSGAASPKLASGRRPRVQEENFGIHQARESTTTASSTSSSPAGSRPVPVGDVGNPSGGAYGCLRVRAQLEPGGSGVPDHGARRGPAHEDLGVAGAIGVPPDEVHTETPPPLEDSDDEGDDEIAKTRIEHSMEDEFGDERYERQCDEEDALIRKWVDALPDPQLMVQAMEERRRAAIIPCEYVHEDGMDADFDVRQLEEARARVRREGLSQMGMIIKTAGELSESDQDALEIIDDTGPPPINVLDQLALISDKVAVALRSIEFIATMSPIAPTSSSESNQESSIIDVCSETGPRGGVAAGEDKGTARTSPSSSSMSSSVVVGCLEVEAGDEEILATDAPRTIKVAADSGAGDHVAAEELVGAHLVVPSPGSRNGCHFVSASGGRMKNRGEAKLKLNDPRAGTILTSTCQVADVTRAVYSVSKMCDEGCVVTFTDAEGIVTKDGKVVARFVREGGLYVAEMKILGSADDTRPSPFTRQGSEE